MLSPQNNKPNQFHRFLTLSIALVIWFVVLMGVLVYRTNITDWWKLRGYDAPAKISMISSQDTMTDYAQKIFYVNHPQVIGQASRFNSECPTSKAEQTIVLGCYHPNQNGIYIYSVTDARLDGVEQVTAAHEMLHAAYDRLSQNERSQVDRQLSDFYANGLQNDRIRKTIEAYKQTEPNDLVNEMHSIFGTEVRSLPPALEQHYKKYFGNRLQVVGYAEKYQSEFISRQDAVTSYDSQLKALKSQIDALEADLKSRQASITQQQKELLALRNSGDVNAYNSAVPAYNASIDSYNSGVQRAKALVAQYNQMVVARNSIALEESKLAQSLNSNAQTINN